MLLMVLRMPPMLLMVLRMLRMLLLSEENANATLDPLLPTPPRLNHPRRRSSCREALLLLLPLPLTDCAYVQTTYFLKPRPLLPFQEFGEADSTQRRILIDL
jgi:hypothetical protein